MPQVSIFLVSEISKVFKLYDLISKKVSSVWTSFSVKINVMNREKVYKKKGVLFNTKMKNTHA